MSPCLHESCPGSILQGEKIVLTQVSHDALSKAFWHRFKVFWWDYKYQMGIRALSGQEQGNQRWWLERQIKEETREKEGTRCLKRNRGGTGFFACLSSTSVIFTWISTKAETVFRWSWILFSSSHSGSKQLLKETKMVCGKAFIFQFSELGGWERGINPKEHSISIGA